MTSPAIMWNHGTLRTAAAALGSHGFDAVLAQPAVDVVLVVLLAPEQAGQRLAHHERGVLVERGRDHLGVEGVRLLASRASARRRGRRPAAPRACAFADDRRSRTEALPPGGDLEHVVRRHLRAGALGVDGVGRAVDHEVVDAVLRRTAPGWRCRTAARCSSRSRRTAARRTARPDSTPVAELGVRRLHARRRRPPPATASRSRRAPPTCCGTRAWAGGAAWPRPGRGCAR